MIQMALHGEGEPRPTLLQQAEQAVKIELFAQWQTYRNGVHMDWDTFRSIDFRALAIAALTGAGFEVKAVNAAHDFPKPFTEAFTKVTLAGTTTRRIQPTVEDVAAHLDQVQG